MSEIILARGRFKTIGGEVGNDSLFKQYPYIEAKNGKHYLLWQYENILELQNIKESKQVILKLEIKND